MQITQILCVIIVMNTMLATLTEAFLDYKIIEAYIKEKRINYACIIGCFTKQEQLKAAKNFSFSRQTSVLNINRIDIELLNTRHNHMGVVLDGDCDNVQYFLIKSGTYRYFDVRHHWLVLSSRNNFTKSFENVELYINADVQVVQPDEIKDVILKNYTVIDVYNPSYYRGGTLKQKILGFYNESDGYNAGEKGLKYWVRRNMTGVTLETIIVLPVPFEGDLMDYLNSEQSPEINTFNRFHYSLMCPCQSYYNFTPNVTLSKSWGYTQEGSKNGTFDGLVGALERKVVDYGSSPLFVRTDRAQVMEYGRRTWTLRAAFIFRNPKSVNSIEIFVKPLPLTVWIMTLCSAALILFSLKLSYFYERKNIKRRVDNSWSYFVICTTGALCQQGMTTTPCFFSGRIVTLFMFLFSLLIYQFYSASLVSHLLRPPTTRIKTVQDILQSNMKVGCEDILYNRDYFLYTTDKPSQELYRRKILRKKNESNFLESEEGLELVKEGKYAFHVELATAYPVITSTYSDKAICELREVQMYRTQPMHANVQKNSPYRDMFDTCLQRLAEHGIMSRELLFWHPKKPECIQSAKSVTSNIGLDDFYPALMILGIGILFSLIILTIEVYVKLEKVSHRKASTVGIYPFIN